MATDNLANARIVQTPGVCGGRARIVGHRVRVQDVVTWHEHQGMTPDEIVSSIPTITLADVQSALAYYFDHLDAIEDEIRADRTTAEKFQRGNLSPLDTKLSQRQLDGKS